MIVVDTSAVVAIVLKEPDGPDFLAILLATDALMSAASLLEMRMVLHARDERNIADLDQLFFRMRVQVEPVTQRQSDIAFDAFRRFGKGSGHAAALNFGDCFAYALASERGLPLLFKGDDFRRTDITPAAPALFES